MYKTMQYPPFVQYSRRDVDWKRIRTDGLDRIQVPLVLETSSYNPIALIEKVNGYTLCTLEGMTLTPDTQKTMQARADMIKHCPEVMRIVKYERLFRKLDNPRWLDYKEFKDSKVESENPQAYIATIKAAKWYAMRTGVCTGGQFDLAVKEGKLNFFLSENTSHVQRVEIDEDFEILQKAEARRNMKLFLLEEVQGM